MIIFEYNLKIKTMETTKLSVKELKAHTTYLNNLVRDDYFIDMGFRHNLADYFMSFPTDTRSKKKLCQYIDIVESMFSSERVEYKHLEKYENEPAVIRRNRRAEEENRWNKQAQILVGKTIKTARYMTEKEAEEYYWDKRPIIIEFTDGTYIIPMMDDEGNNGGSLTSDSNDLYFPTLSSY